MEDEQEYTKESRRRRQAVQEYFPKLAYLCSDVVVMLTTESFVCSACYDQVMEMVVAANQNVSDIVRPALIIIHNQCKLTDNFDVDTTTERFLESHDADGELSKYFSTIRVSLVRFISFICVCFVLLVVYEYPQEV